MPERPKLAHRLYRSYLRGPNHPAKLRIIRWIERRVFPPQGILFDVAGGIRMHLHPRDYWEYDLLKTDTGTYLPCLNSFIKENSNLGDTVVIAGVSFGLQTILASRAVGETGCVIAVDPHPKALVRTHRNIVANNLADNIKLVCVGLGDQAELVPIGDIPDDQIGFGSFVARQAGQMPFYVRVEPVSNTLKSLGINAVRMIVLDVIGFEMPILKGMKGGLLPEIISVIVHPWVVQKTGHGLDEFQNFLEELGYSCHTLDGKSPNDTIDLVDKQLVGVRKGVATPKWIERVSANLED